MIKNSFIFLPGIGIRKEQQLWKQGVKDWADFLRADRVSGISPGRKKSYDLIIAQAQRSLQDDDLSFFKGKIPSVETWRLYPLFKDEACFLDIEIDSYRNVILVGISNYFTTNFFVQGFNLEKPLLEKELRILILIKEK